MRWMYHIGRYMRLLAKSFRKPEKFSVFKDLLVTELESIGLQSVGIVALLSIFMGAVICLQTAHQIGGWIPTLFMSKSNKVLECGCPTLVHFIRYVCVIG